MVTRNAVSMQVRDPVEKCMRTIVIALTESHGLWGFEARYEGSDAILATGVNVSDRRDDALWMARGAIAEALTVRAQATSD